MEKNIRRFFFSVFVQDFFAIPLARFFIRLKVKANYVTLLGLLSSIASGVLYIEQSYILGSLFFFAALILDSTDGRVARGTNTFSDFGARLDAITDKVRSFFVAFCFIWSLNYGLTVSVLIFAFYNLLPITRAIMSRNDKDFYDPTILFWDATPFKNWFVKHKVWGFYNGWERSVLALTVAPLMVYKIEVFFFAVILEQLLFVLGLCFFKDSKVGA
jgi:phosphatidylglycerophosphate synthase